MKITENPKLADIDALKLSITRTSAPKQLLPPEKLVFGHSFTGMISSSCLLLGWQNSSHFLMLTSVLDHMLSIEWNSSHGWFEPRIIPYQNLSLDPASSVFHYGFECFEGMKAYRGKDGRTHLFRPDRNMARLNSSSARIALPTFNPVQLIEVIKKLVKLEDRFIPK
jgi:branched-chain amino acid aminotransferase